MIPVVVSLFLAILFVLPSYKTAERRLYDLMLHIKPPVAESPQILLLNIDDQAIAQVGIWPWSRNIVADGLILLREFKAGCTVFDIEYVDSSPRGVDSRYLEQTLPDLFKTKFSGLKENTSGLINALSTGNIPLKEAPDYATSLADLTDSLQQDLTKAVGKIARDNDAYLGQAARANGSAFFTVNMIDDNIQLYHVTDELKQYVDANIPIPLINRNKNNRVPFFKSSSIQPTIYPIISGGRGAGFPNVEVDDDGVRRRINLLVEYKGKTYAQLILRPLLYFLGNPEVSLSGTTITLKDARLSDGTVKTINIPLSPDGKLLINWPATRFSDSFRSLSFKQLVVHDLVLTNLVSSLTVMEQAGYFANYQGETPPLDLYRYAEGLKADILDGTRPPADMEEFAQTREKFLAETALFLNGTAEKSLLGQIDGLIADPQLDAETKASYAEIRAQAQTVFAAVKSDYDQLTQIRAILKKDIPGSIVLIGLTGISTTDTGVNPFEKNYMNVGTHAAVANTILTSSFLTEWPLWMSLLLAIAMSFTVTLLIRKKEPKTGIIIGLVVVVLTAAAGVLVFLLFKSYFPLITPLLSLAITILGVSIVKFFKSEGEKSFLRNAFSRYLSSDVISQLLQDPDRLNLGGEKKNLSVIFTDIKGFSTISENLDPVQLVGLLNEYLTAMSDIILEECGTIDKYEGDAIISFFGAPVPLDDHPYRACLAAIRMKRAEQALNERLIAEGKMSSPLMTRIGINTGEMVVGNMGTPRKMDYTVMGSSVNLASRLEGVNKQYGTWILTSENVVQQAGDSFLTRKLDRVRVIGIDTPVRLYEVLEERSRADKTLLEGLSVFHRALELFEDKHWDEAEKTFGEVLAILPEDGPATTFQNRCREYQKKKPADSWDGVFNLNTK